MKNKLMFLLFLLLTFAYVSAEGHLSVYNLTCEQTENPLGIETLHPRFSWQLQAETRATEQSAYQLLVAETAADLARENGTTWNTGKVSASTSVLVPFNGIPLRAQQTYYWKVKVWDRAGNASPWSLPAQFTMGLFTAKDWSGAQWIALEKDIDSLIQRKGLHYYTAEHKAFTSGKKVGRYTLPLFRKDFAVKKQVTRAIAYVSGLGHMDLFLNGKKVGDNFLDPGWTKYDVCAQYVTFNITPLLTSGTNTVGAMLGNGFFNIPNERYYKMIASYGAPRMILKIRLEYADGSTSEIVSDKSWKAAAGPITYSSIYGGEDYDANREQPNWSCPNFNDATWTPVVLPRWTTKLQSQRATPVKIRDRIPTVRLFQNHSGAWVYDLGQNFSGIVHLAVKASGKQAIKLYPAELLNPDSTVNQSASGDPFYFTYTTRGGAPESWQPRFTYYGFRYVQLDGAVPIGKPNPHGLPEVHELTGLHTTNAADEAGTFTCSDNHLNQIYRLIDWSIRSNMASVLTDCPHREKLGWLEQAHLMQYSIQYRYNLSRLYSKIMNDMRSTQAANGQIATTAPELVEFEGGFKDTPEWGSAFIVVPWYVYQWYGDKELITTYYTDMARYIDFLASQASDHILSYGLGDWFDIGPNPPGISQLTSNGVTATAIYYYDVMLMSKMATLLGRTADARMYTERADAIKVAFNRAFFHYDTKNYDRNSQAANAVAIYMDLVEPEYKQDVLQHLLADITGRNYALTAGDVGYRYVLRALEENNASDVVYRMNSQYDVPGYGWQLAHGATALTESWQAYGFVSNNHFMLGHLMEWLFSGVGGIRPKEGAVGYKEFVISPQPVGEVREATTTYQSPYGLIRCEWKKNADTFILRLEVPANSTAYVHLPATELGQITESGLLVSDLPTLQQVSTEKQLVVLKVGSGVYHFRVSNPACF